MAVLCIKVHVVNNKFDGIILWWLLWMQIAEVCAPACNTHFSPHQRNLENSGVLALAHNREGIRGSISPHTTGIRCIWVIGCMGFQTPPQFRCSRVRLKMCFYKSCTLASSRVRVIIISRLFIQHSFHGHWHFLVVTGSKTYDLLSLDMHVRWSERTNSMCPEHLAFLRAYLFTSHLWSDLDSKYPLVGTCIIFPWCSGATVAIWEGSLKAQAEKATPPAMIWCDARK